MDYSEEEYINLSGIQHFVFCKRQWALIYVEDKWADNIRTVEGEHIHETVHDPANTEKRNEIYVTRAMPVFSRKLGFSGECDVVEFHVDKAGVTLQNHEGKYLPFPIEYKRGKPKESNEDIMQLVAQAICLEEMLCCSVEHGFLYYWEIRRRVEVEITEDLRRMVKQISCEMHEYLKRNYTPKVKTNKRCKMCSLNNVCVPQLCKSTSVKDYINRRMGD